MLTIGFTNQYYTLWNVSKENTYHQASNGSYFITGYNVKNHYIKNISMCFDTTKELFPDLTIDMDLKGESIRWISSGLGEAFQKKQDDLTFSFGKLQGQLIGESLDVWQLNRAMFAEKTRERKVYARRRLLDLNELVKYAWTEQVYDMEATTDAYHANPRNYSKQYIAVKRKYATHAQVIKFDAEKAESQLSGHHFNNGEKIKISIKKIDGFSFEGNYGTTFVMKFITSDNKIVKYMGSTPPDISTEEFTEISATVKHDSYKGDETKLLRIKKVVKK